jgi:hypothetical protein
VKSPWRPLLTRIHPYRTCLAEKGLSYGILLSVLAGFLLVVSGGLIAYSSREDWLVAHLANNESATLNLAGSRYGTALLAFGMIIVALGIARIARGYAKDNALHRIASVASLAAIALALARAELFLVDHNLSATSTASYKHLDLKLGVLTLLGGVAVTFLSRLA